MGRPNIRENPLFIEGQKRYEPIKSIVDDAKVEADLLVKRARRKVEDETLALVASLKKRGLSNYGIGLITGVTRHDLLTALIARAAAYSGGELSTFDDGTETCEGWTWGPQVVGGWTPYVSPEGERYEVGFNAEQYVEWRKPDGSVMTFAERDELPQAVEIFAHEKMENA
jgi:hypothetical protein